MSFLGVLAILTIADFERTKGTITFFRKLANTLQEKKGGHVVFEEYYLAESISDALSFLNKGSGDAVIIAGGTDLLLDLSEGKKRTKSLVDITRILELKNLSMECGIIKIGAAITHAQVGESELIWANAPALAMAANKVGSLQIRNIATVVGNIINAQPAADTAVALTALGAKVTIMDTSGTRDVNIEQLYEDVGKSKVDSRMELVTEVIIPAHEQNQSSYFVRLEQRKALALPMLNIAVMVSLEKGQQRFEWVRIAMAPVGPGPMRATNAEKILKGAAIDDEIITKAAYEAAAQANPRDSDLRGSREYRLQVLPALVKRCIAMAVAQVNKG